MTQQANYSPPQGDSGTSSAPATARQEAGEIGRSATEHAGQVANVAGEQARQVAAETGRQARHLLEEGVDQLRDQAREGQQKLAGGLRGIADQLRQMSDRAEGSDTVSEAVRQVSQRANGVADWLESRQPGDLLDELRAFARRRPGLFLAGAAVTGMLAGRLTRNMASTMQGGQAGHGQRADGPGPAGRPHALDDHPEAQTAEIPLPTRPAGYPPTSGGSTPMTGPAGRPGPGPVQ